MAEMGAPISLDGVAVHPDCWCVCLCYLHYTPENQKMVKCTFWYQLTRVVLDKIQRAVKWLFVCACVYIYTAGHKKRATIFWTIIPTFLDGFQHFVHQ